MTKQFKYPDGHQIGSGAEINWHNVTKVPDLVRQAGFPLFVSPSERYAPEVSAFIVYGRGRG